jgi:hypothetical protein
MTSSSYSFASLTEPLPFLFCIDGFDTGTSCFKK